MPNVDKSDSFAAAASGELDVVLRSIFGAPPAAVSGEYIPPGAGLGRFGADAGVKLKPEEAFRLVQDEYNALMAQFRSIIDTYMVNLGGVPAPVCASYNAAVASYQRLATSVFTQILSVGGWGVSQKLQKLDGSEGEVKQLYLSQPGNALNGLVLPPTFAGEACLQPKTKTKAAGTGELGWAPPSWWASAASAGGTAASFASLNPYVKVALVAATMVVGILTVGAAVSIAWPKDIVAEARAARSAGDEKLKCLDGAKARGLTFDQAMQVCDPEFAKGSSFSDLWWLLGIVGVGVVGGYLIFRYTSAAEKARRENIEKAKAYESRLKREGARAVEEAKKGKPKPFDRRYAKSGAGAGAGGFPKIPGWDPSSEAATAEEELETATAGFGRAGRGRNRGLTVNFKRCTCS